MPKKTEEQVITTKEKETILPASPEKLAPTSILTISADADIETPESIEDTNWHELQNAYRTKKILTGTLGGIEKLERDGTIAIVYYKDQRIVIPLSEMMINLKEDASSDYGELLNRQNKILGNMLGAEIDFLIKGIDNKSRSVAASRKDAMLKKRQIFYLPDANGNSRDEKSRTFSSNSKRSHILRTSSRSRRLILSSIVSLAVSLKCTRTI